jgi:transcription elongation factor Elf1
MTLEAPKCPRCGKPLQSEHKTVSRYVEFCTDCGIEREVELHFNLEALIKLFPGAGTKYDV